MVSQVQQQAQSLIEAQKDRAVEGVESVAQALRQTGQQLQGEGPASFVGQYADSAANQIEQLADYLRYSDMELLMDDAQRFARREPALFVGGAFALGLMVARFLKSSSPTPELTSSYGPSGQSQQRSYGYEQQSYGRQNYGSQSMDYGRQSYGSQGISRPGYESGQSSGPTQRSYGSSQRTGPSQQNLGTSQGGSQNREQPGNQGTTPRSSDSDTR